jgi:hypothetical protein
MMQSAFHCITTLAPNWLRQSLYIRPSPPLFGMTNLLVLSLLRSTSPTLLSSRLDLIASNVFVMEVYLTSQDNPRLKEEEFL